MISLLLLYYYIYTHTRIECVCISFSHYRISLTRKRITKELRRRELGRVCVSYIVESAGSPMRESSVELPLPNGCTFYLTVDYFEDLRPKIKGMYY